MIKNIIFRKVNAKDAEEYIKLVDFVWRDAYKDIFPEEVFLDRESHFEEKLKNFDKIFYNDNIVFTYVVEYNNKIIGTLWGTMNSDYLYFKEKGYADLMALYIHPNYQGCGIGTKLKEYFINWARNNSAKKFVIGVLKDNKKARKVYEKWGGVLSEYTQPFVKLGREYNEVFYEFDL